LTDPAQPPVPDNEADRIKWLNDLNIDFDVPITELRELCQIAADIAGAEVALISLVGEDEQKFAASIGLDDVGLAGLRGTSRVVSFCAHAIMNPEQLVVEDATQDIRFADNPLVTDSPGMRAYAGTPLEPAPDVRVGTLCVIDRTPRTYDTATLKALRGIGNAVTALLVAHRDQLRLSQALAQSERQHLAALEMARMDGLTGLLNATAFREVFTQETENPGRAIALVSIDVDQFKVVNDTYGHCFGDEYLETIANALKAATSADSQIGRLGGDEFGLILQDEDATPEKIMQIIDQCRHEITTRTCKLDRVDLGRVSFGVTIDSDGAQSSETLFKQADIALYVAKENGRNQSIVYDASYRNRLDQRTLRTEFIKALENGEIVPFYQAKWDRQSGETIGFEVLCRWDHPERGLLRPFAFQTMLSDPQTAPLLTRKMVSQACHDHKKLRQTGLDPGCLAFNVTRADLNDPAFIDMLAYLLDETELNWDQIVIEVTETAVLGQDGGQVYKSMAALRDRGVTIALDDFGTGHGGLQHLVGWPIDTIKIDKSFTAVICTDDRTLAIVKSIVSLAKSLGLSVIAEGIETQQQASLLRDMNCDKGQGYLYGRPMSRANLEIILQKNTERSMVVATEIGISPEVGLRGTS
jgi:diguanylate cyclase (GGDEF)-like protein